MSVPPAQLGGVDDPRLSSAVDRIGESKDIDFPVKEVAPEGNRRMSIVYTDSSIPFEEYHWWANKSREYEQHLKADQGYGSIFQVLLGKKKKEGVPGVIPPGEKAADASPDAASGEKSGGENTPHTWNGANAPNADRYGITDDEWYNAQRSVRTATWGSIFYLITTDILGPYSVPWAIAQMGYGPGAALYIVFGLLAVYSGLQLWKMFLGLDSTKYPLRNYGDLAMRVYGNGARIGVNVLQSFQFFLNVALLIESNGQGTYPPR
jgi:hypothetical protein